MTFKYARFFYDLALFVLRTDQIITSQTGHLSFEVVIKYVQIIDIIY